MKTKALVEGIVGNSQTDCNTKNNILGYPKTKIEMKEKCWKMMICAAKVFQMESHRNNQNDNLKDQKTSVWVFETKCKGVRVVILVIYF